MKKKNILLKKSLTIIVIINLFYFNIIMNDENLGINTKIGIYYYIL